MPFAGLLRTRVIQGAAAAREIDMLDAASSDTRAHPKRHAGSLSDSIWFLLHDSSQITVRALQEGACQ